MENRTGLVVDLEVTRSVGETDWDAALTMLDRLRDRATRITVGADRAYDNKRFVRGCRERQITPHVAQFAKSDRRHSQIDRRTTRHEGYRVSQRKRKRVEEIFGWWKTVAGGDKLRFRGVSRNRMYAQIVASAYNVLRMAKLETQPALA